MVETGAEVNAEAEAEAEMNGEAEADTPFPLPTELAVTLALALAVSENPPSVERETDVDPPRSVLTLFAVEIEAEIPADVSGLLADTEELTIENDGDTDALGTKDVADDAAALLFNNDTESEIVGALFVFPNDADAETGERRVVAVALSVPKAASVEVEDFASTALDEVDCAVLGLVLSL